MNFSTLILFGSIVHACTVHLVRYDANRTPYVRVNNDGSPIVIAGNCDYATVNPGIHAIEPIAVTAVFYALTLDKVVIVDDQAPVVGAPEWVLGTPANAVHSPVVRALLAANKNQPLTKFDVTQFCWIISPPDHRALTYTDALPAQGIKNLGGTCYLNTAIQMLANIPTFRHRLADIVNNHRAAIPVGTIASQLDAVFATMEAGRPIEKARMAPLAARLRVSYPRLFGNSPSSQADSFDAVECLIKEVEKDIFKLQDPGTPSIFNNLLYTRHIRDDVLVATGAIQSRATLANCRLNLYELPAAARGNAAVQIDLITLIPAHLAPSLDNTGAHQYQHRLEDLPPYLFIQLPRFDNTKKRLDNPVGFPALMDLTALLVPDWIGARTYQYELVGVGEHTGGRRSNNGHWTARVLRDDGNWYHMNDHTATACAVPASPSVAAAYFLYRRVIPAAGYTAIGLPARPAGIQAPPAMPPGTSAAGGKDRTNSSRKSSGKGNSGGGGSSSGGGNKKRQESASESEPSKSKPSPKPADGSDATAQAIPSTLITLLLLVWNIM